MTHHKKKDMRRVPGFFVGLFLVFSFVVPARSIAQGISVTDEAFLPQGPSVVAANVGIYSTTSTFEAGGDFFVMFDVVNHDSFVQPDIRFGLELYREESSPVSDQVSIEIPETFVFDENVILPSGESRHMTLSYRIPDSVAGRFRVSLVSYSKSGLPLAFRELGVYQFPGNADSDPRCSLSGEGTSFFVGCERVRSGISSHVAVKRGSLFGDSIFERSYPESLGSSEQFPLEFEFVPGDYAGTVTFSDSDGSMAYSPFQFRFSVGENPVIIQNVRFDKLSYAKGDTANILLIIAGISGGSPMDGGRISLGVTDRDGVMCVARKDVPVWLESDLIEPLWEIDILVEKDCRDAVVSVSVIGEDGVVLSSYDTGPLITLRTEEKAGDRKRASEGVSVRSVFFASISGLFLISLCAILVWRLWKSGGGSRFISGILFLVGSIFLLTDVNGAAALTLVSYPAAATATTVVNLDKQAYVPGERIRLSGKMVLDAGTYQFGGDHFVSWADVDDADPSSPITKTSFSVTQSPNHFGCDRRYTSTLEDEWAAPTTVGSHFLGIKHGDDGAKSCYRWGKGTRCNWTSAIIIHGGKGCAGEMNGANGIATVRGSIPFSIVPSLIHASCSSADGAVVPTAPASDLCFTGTPSAVSGTGPWFWTCSGSDPASSSDDASCSAAKTPSLHLCVNGAELSTASLAFGDTRFLRTFYGVDDDSGTACSTTGGNTDVTASTAFTESGQDAVALSGSGTSSVSMTAKNPDTGTGQQSPTEIVTATYVGQSKSFHVTVSEICSADCSSVADQVCKKTKFTVKDSCGGDYDECDGTRDCSFNWKEVMPGL